MIDTPYHRKLTILIVLIVAIPLASALAESPACTGILDRAETRIEKYRKGNVTLQLVDPNAVLIINDYVTDAAYADKGISHETIVVQLN